MFSRNAWGARSLSGALATMSFLGASRALAQSSQFESVIRAQDARNVAGYVQPLTDVLVANLNVGFFHSAYVPKSKFGVALDFVGMGTQVDDAMKTYVANTPNGFNPPTFTTATIFGGTGTTVTHSSNPALQYRGSDGFIETDMFPTAVPQLTIGGLFGTEVAGRYFTSSIASGLFDEDFPELKLLGLAVRHSVSQYFQGLPFDLAVSFVYNDLTWGDIVSLDATAIGAQLGKSFSILSVYAGLAQESGTMTLSYTPTNPQATPITVDVDSEGGVRFTGGLGLRLGPIHLFGDATFGNVTTFAGGLRIAY
jgi:hypothetical protein